MKKVVVEELEGGWVLDWHDPRKIEDYSRWLYLDNRPSTSGREIYTDKKKLLKRLTDFL
ncbi:hypothetical protein [Rhodoligotrophos defluvii]|uniref:hypothetical protein n=1 Tax=Rhodoligotrophos defluvii TaxID=2561934 RepID=UPI001485674A|nr:hypothetical protein [Rhodoligotrophos defluvii]